MWAAWPGESIKPKKPEQIENWTIGFANENTLNLGVEKITIWEEIEHVTKLNMLHYLSKLTQIL